jgi:hypothetical protein
MHEEFLARLAAANDSMPAPLVGRILDSEICSVTQWRYELLDTQKMTSIIRIVPNLGMTTDETSRAFYAEFLGLDVQMDMEWNTTFVAAANPTAQLSTITRDATAPVVPNVTVEVDDVDALYAEAVRQGLALYRKGLWRRIELPGAFLLGGLNGYLVRVFKHDVQCGVGLRLYQRL